MKDVKPIYIVLIMMTGFATIRSSLVIEVPPLINIILF